MSCGLTNTGKRVLSATADIQPVLSRARHDRSAQIHHELCVDKPWQEDAVKICRPTALCCQDHVATGLHVKPPIQQASDCISQDLNMDGYVPSYDLMATIEQQIWPDNTII